MELDDQKFLDTYDLSKANSFQERQKYYDLLAKQKSAQSEALAAEGGDMSAKDKMQVASSMLEQTPGQGGTGTLGKGAMTAGMMSGNPWLFGGGLALSTLDSARALKQQQEDAKVAAYMDTVKRQQQALQGMSNMFSGNLLG
jgi:hypothetical protein